MFVPSDNGLMFVCISQPCIDGEILNFRVENGYLFRTKLAEIIYGSLHIQGRHDRFSISLPKGRRVWPLQDCRGKPRNPKDAGLLVSNQSLRIKLGLLCIQKTFEPKWGYYEANTLSRMSPFWNSCDPWPSTVEVLGTSGWTDCLRGVLPLQGDHPKRSLPSLVVSNTIVIEHNKRGRIISEY